MSDPEAQIYEGGCRCGAVRYVATGAPYATSLCHCRSCRLSAGAPSLAWVIFRHGDVRIVDGELSVHESSPGVERGFCGKCGTSLSYSRANRPGFFDVTAAPLDDANCLPPAKEIWTSQRLAWVAPNPNLPQFDELSTPPPVKP
jgi:hypothetical protein